MRFDASPRPKKGVCHLQDLARTSVTLDTLPFGQIWFRSVIRVRRTGVLTNRDTRKHLPSIPGAKTLRIAVLFLIYSTAEYSAPAWCRSAHTRLIDSILNDALRIVTGCLRPTPMNNFSVFSGIQPAELRRQEAPLSLANCSSLGPGHILHGQLTES